MTHTMNCPSCGHDIDTHCYDDDAHMDACHGAMYTGEQRCRCHASPKQIARKIAAAAWDAGHDEGRKDAATTYARAANGLDPPPDTANPYREDEPA